MVLAERGSKSDRWNGHRLRCMILHVAPMHDQVIWLVVLHAAAGSTTECLFSTVARHANGAVKTVVERKPALHEPGILGMMS